MSGVYKKKWGKSTHQVICKLVIPPGHIDRRSLVLQLIAGDSPVLYMKLIYDRANLTVLICLEWEPSKVYTVALLIRAGARHSVVHQPVRPGAAWNNGRLSERITMTTHLLCVQQRTDNRNGHSNTLIRQRMTLLCCFQLTERFRCPRCPRNC